MRKRREPRLNLLPAPRAVQKLGPGDHSDGGGLVLRVRADGAAQWVFRYTSPTNTVTEARTGAQRAQRREMGLGVAYLDNEAVTGEGLALARQAATKARAQLQQGLDPIDERKSAKAADRAASKQRTQDKERERLTLARVARNFHEEFIEPNLTCKHAAQWIASLENHVPAAIWHMPIADIDAATLLQGLEGIRAHRTARAPKDTKIRETQRRVRQRLEQIFARAIALNQCKHNPAAEVRASLKEPKGKRRKTGSLRALPYGEVPAFLARVRAAEGCAARCLEFAVLTASRTGEVIAAEWSEFDLDAALWVVPGARMKSGEPHTVYLSPEAVRVVRAMQGFHVRWVFASPVKKDAHLSNMAMLALLDRLGVRGATTVHGLCRAAFSTWSYENDAARGDVIEAALSHSEADKVKAAYARTEFAAERRKLLADWAAYLNKGGAIAQLKAA